MSAQNQAETEEQEKTMARWRFLPKEHLMLDKAENEAQCTALAEKTNLWQSQRGFTSVQVTGFGADAQRPDPETSLQKSEAPER